jgi:hypothetical protein
MNEIGIGSEIELNNTQKKGAYKSYWHNKHAAPLELGLLV